MKRFTGIVVLTVLIALAVAGLAWSAAGDSLLKTRYDITATVAEINKMDGVTATTAELNYTDGVTSAIQTQLDALSAGTGTTLADTKILIGNSAGTSTPQSLTMTGPVTASGITNGGVIATSLSTKSWQIMVAGSAASAGGDATETVTNHNISNENLLFASLATTDDTDLLNTVANSDHSVLTMVSSADPSTAHSYDYVGIINNPSIGDVPWQIIGAFNSTTAGGDATETVSVSGSLTTDLVIVALEDAGTNVVTIAAARVSTDGTVTITLSADPSTDARMSGIVVRYNSTDDAESHSVVYAGSSTTGGGSVSEAITVTGALATDSVIAVQSTLVVEQLGFTNIIANTINATFDADPGADEVITWMVIRAN